MDSTTDYAALGVVTSRENRFRRPFDVSMHPSFLDALAALRRLLWTQRIAPTSPASPHHPKITNALLDVLAYAA